MGKRKVKSRDENPTSGQGLPLVTLLHLLSNRLLSPSRQPLRNVVGRARKLNQKVPMKMRKRILERGREAGRAMALAGNRLLPQYLQTRRIQARSY